MKVVQNRSLTTFVYKFPKNSALFQKNTSKCQSQTQVFESSSSIGGRTKSIKLSENVIVNLGANWLAGQRNPLVRFVAIRNLEEKEEELCVSVLNEHLNDITDEYMPLADEYMMALDRLETGIKMSFS